MTPSSDNMACLLHSNVIETPFFFKKKKKSSWREWGRGEEGGRGRKREEEEGGGRGRKSEGEGENRNLGLKLLLDPDSVEGKEREENLKRISPLCVGHVFFCPCTSIHFPYFFEHIVYKGIPHHIFFCFSVKLCAFLWRHGEEKKKKKRKGDNGKKGKEAPGIRYKI